MAHTEGAFASSSGLGHLLDEIPELNQLVTEATNHNWSAQRFQNAVENSDWYRNHSATARQIIIQRANDPASYEHDLNQAESSITALARQLGMGLNDGQIQAIATHALLTGNSSNQQWLTQAISNHEDYGNLKTTDNLRGSMAGTVSQLQQLAAQYGIKWSPAELAIRAQNVLDGTTTLDTYKNDAVSWAKSAFPGLAKQLDNGQTLSQLADPYVQSMSQILEMNPNQLDTFTPMIRRALQGFKDKTGDYQPTSLMDFEQQLRQDPRYWKTNGAMDTVSSALLKLGADWGFGPEG